MEADRNVLFHGTIPKNYDRYLGPVIFEPFARDIARRLRDRKIQSLLEIACGTGIVTRHLRSTLPRSTEIIATDLNPDMFEFAKSKFRGGEPVRWQQADASALPFPDKSFDAAVCQFGLMFVMDKEAAVREAYRVLRRAGVFLFNVWDSFDANPFAQIAHTTIASLFDRDPPQFYEIPFSLHRVPSRSRICGPPASRKLNRSPKRSLVEAVLPANSRPAWYAAIRSEPKQKSAA